MTLALQIIERDIELKVFQKKVGRDSCLIATGISCPGETFSRQLPEKTVCFHLSLSLLYETPKMQSSRLKVVEDIKLLFNSYQILITW